MRHIFFSTSANLSSFKVIIRLVFLFVGVVIGAGFATGSEIMLYFKNCGYLSVLFAAVIMGLLCVFFCYFGKLQKKIKYIKNLMKIVVFLSSMVTYCVMLSAVSELIETQFGIKYFGIFTAFIVAILMLYDMRIIKLLNLIIVPLIMALMLVILIIGKGEVYSGFNPLQSILYAGMNMLLGGYFMSEEGAELSHKQIACTGVIVTIVMGGLMSICYVISMQAFSASMPVFEVARSHGLGVLAAVVVYLAIFTTLIGSGKAFADMIFAFVPNKFIIFVLCFVLGFYFDGTDFSSLVSFSYSQIGNIGFVICIIVVLSVLCNYFKMIIANSKIKKLGLRQPK